MADVVSLAELRTYRGWTRELDEMATRVLAFGRGLLEQAHQAALERWFEASGPSSLSSMTAVVIDATGQRWRQDAAFCQLLEEEFAKVLRTS